MTKELNEKIKNIDVDLIKELGEKYKSIVIPWYETYLFNDEEPNEEIDDQIKNDLLEVINIVNAFNAQRK